MKLGENYKYFLLFRENSGFFRGTLHYIQQNAKSASSFDCREKSTLNLHSLRFGEYIP